MWEFIKDNKDNTFEYQEKKLWYSIDQTKEERAVSKRVSKAVNMLREHMISKHSFDQEQARRAIDGDWAKGLVYYKAAEGTCNITRLFDRRPESLLLHVTESATSSGLDFDFKAKLADINSA